MPKINALDISDSASADLSSLNLNLANICAIMDRLTNAGFAISFIIKQHETDNKRYAIINIAAPIDPLSINATPDTYKDK